MREDVAWIHDVRESIGEGESEVRISSYDLRRLLRLAEKGLEVAAQANALLSNAYSLPEDDRGMRFLSQDAVKLQWALREIEGGEDSSGAVFSV